MGGWVGLRNGWMGGWVGREMMMKKVRGVYGFSSLMKQKKKAKNYAVFCFAGKRIFLYIYDVITWEKIKKSSAIHYFLLPPSRGF
jgi:hypothetical protein